MTTELPSPASNAETITRVLRALGLSYEEMQVIINHSSAAHAARSGVMQAVHPGRVTLYQSIFGIYEFQGPVPSPTELYRQAMEFDLEAALSFLQEKERQVVDMRFGLDGSRRLKLEDVGSKLGVTRERIRQIESKALAKLRHGDRARRLGYYRDDDPWVTEAEQMLHPALRTKQALRRAGIHRLEQLQGMTGRQLQDVPGVSRAMVNEVVFRLRERGVDLANTIKLPEGYALEPLPNKDTSLGTVDDLQLSERPRNCLKRAQVDTITELCSMTSDRLLTFASFGYRSLHEVIWKLQQRGLSLRDNPEYDPSCWTPNQPQQ